MTRLPKGYCHIKWLTGWCPVQAEGTIDGNPFYFRARHDSWTLTITKPGDNPIDVSLLVPKAPKQAIYYYKEPYGAKSQHKAGYMPLDEARACIRWCAAHFKRLQAQKQTEAQERERLEHGWVEL